MTEEPRYFAVPFEDTIAPDDEQPPAEVWKLFRGTWVVLDREIEGPVGQSLSEAEAASVVNILNARLAGEEMLGRYAATGVALTIEKSTDEQEEWAWGGEKFGVVFKVAGTAIYMAAYDEATEIHKRLGDLLSEMKKERLS